MSILNGLPKGRDHRVGHTYCTFCLEPGSEIVHLLFFCPVFQCFPPWPGSPAVFHLETAPKRHITVGWPVDCKLACSTGFHFPLLWKPVDDPWWPGCEWVIVTPGSRTCVVSCRLGTDDIGGGILYMLPHLLHSNACWTCVPFSSQSSQLWLHYQRTLLRLNSCP